MENTRGERDLVHDEEDEDEKDEDGEREKMGKNSREEKEKILDLDSLVTGES